MKQLFRGILFFFLTLHCYSHEEPIEITFSNTGQNWFTKTLTTLMQLWSDSQDMESISKIGKDINESYGQFFIDSSIGKLYCISIYLDNVINDQLVVYEGDKHYLLTILDKISKYYQAFNLKKYSRHDQWDSLIKEIKEKIESITSH